MDIDREKLRELASDPSGSLKTICAGLGISDPTLYGEFKKDPSLRKIYDDAREAAAMSTGKEPRNKPRKKQGKKSPKRESTNTPPAMVIPKAA